MKTATEIRETMAYMNGTTQYYRFSPVAFFPVATDGVVTLAEMAECFWLLDIIGSYQTNKRLSKDFQVWTLDVNKDKSAVLKGYNDMVLIITQDIPFTDFPLDTVTMYLMNGVLLMPSEY